MSLEIVGNTEIWHYEDLGATEAYTYDNPHKTLLLRCSHGDFGENSWIKYGVISIDYPKE